MKRPIIKAHAFPGHVAAGLTIPFAAMETRPEGIILYMHIV